jgi:hypothetical protein
VGTATVAVVRDVRRATQSDVALRSGPSGLSRRGADITTAETRILALRHQWRHAGAMVSVQIKDVPESTHAVLRQRAAAAHQSLQEYLRSRLIAEASSPTLDEVLDRAGGRSGGVVPLGDAVRTIREDRGRR